MRRLEKALVLLSFFVCCIETHTTAPLTIVWPYATGGEIRISRVGHDAAIATGKLGADGTAAIRIGPSDGYLEGRISGLSRRSLAPGNEITSAGEMTYTFPIGHTDGVTPRTVIISEEMIIGWAAATKDPTRHDEWKAGWSDIVSAGRPELMGVLSAIPYDPPKNTAETPMETVTTEIAAYLFRLGRARMMPLLSYGPDFQAEFPLNELVYIYHAARDASDGMDGLVSGQPIELAEGVYLPPTHFREYFAHGIRLAADDPQWNATGTRSSMIIDLLRSISEKDAPRYGQSTHLDTRGPQTHFVAPVVPENAAHATINGTTPMMCVGTDANDIVSMRIEIWDGMTNVSAAVLRNQNTELNQLNDDGTITSTATADLVSTAYPDSELFARCVAVDKWSNHSDEDALLGILTDNTSALVSVIAPLQGQHIFGSDVSVICSCQDTEVLCELARPTDAVTCADPIHNEETAVTTVSCLLDVRDYAEGDVEIECAGKTPGFAKPETAKVTAIVDNVRPGLARIKATLEKPIANGYFTARALNENGIGEIVSLCEEATDCISSTSGDVVVPLSDAYSGDIIIEMQSGNWDSKATYIYAPTNSQIEIAPNEKLALVLEGYTPGAEVSGVLSGLSTLGSCYVLGAVGKMDYAEAKRLSDTLIGQHFLYDEVIDYRHAIPPDLTAEVVSSIDDSSLSALSHLGVAFLGYRAAKDLDPHMSPVPSHITWKKLCQDLQYDLRLNGIADGVVTLLDNGTLPLTGDSFRYDLAGGIDEFVLRAPPSDTNTSILHNVSTITRNDLGRRYGVYDRISTDSSELFDPPTTQNPLRPYDREAPKLLCLRPSPDGTDVIGTSVPVLECECRDDFGVDDFVVTSPSEWATSDRESSPDYIFALNLRIADIPSLQDVSGDYALDISLACHDDANNEGTATISVNVDQTPPVVEILTTGLGEPVDGSYVVTSSSVLVHFSVQDAFGIDFTKLNNEDATQTGASTYSGTITLEAGRVVTARAQAFDHAGNTADDTAQFLYVDDAPIVEITSPTATETYGATLDVLATARSESTAIFIDRVIIHEPPEYDALATVIIQGSKATVSLRGVSTAPLTAMAASGRQPRVCMSATNVAELTSEVTCVTGFLVDGESPTGKIESPQSGQAITTTSVDVIASVSDESEIESVTIDGLPAIFNEVTGYWLRTLTALPQGEKTIEVRATDAVKNEGVVDTIVIAVDSIPPTVQAELRRTSFAGPLVDITRPVSGQIWQLIYADDHSGINGVTVEIQDSIDAIGDPVPLPDCNASLCTAYPIDTAQLDTGRYNTETIAYDIQNTASESYVIPFHADNDAPIPVVMSHSDGQYVPFRHVTLLGRLDDDYPAHGTITVTTGVDTWSTTTDTSGNWSVAIEIDEAGQVSISATDDAGNATSEPTLMNLYIDDENPTVELTQPVGVMGCVGRTMTVSCVASDNVDAGLRVYFDEPWLAEYAAGVPGSGYGTSSSITLTGVLTEHLVDAAGRVRVTCGAVDGSGRRAQIPAGIDLCRDVEPPYINSISPVDGSWLSTTSTTFVGAARDLSGVAAITCNGTTVTPQENDTTEAVSWSCANGVASDGGTANSIGATDGLGNTTPLTELHNITLYADGTPPVVSMQLTDPMHDPLDLARAHAGGIRVAVTADDPRGFAPTPRYVVTIDEVVDITSTCTHVVSDGGTHLDIECLADTSLLADGSHIVAASVEDSLENGSRPEDASIGFRADNTAPIAAVSAPNVVGTTSTEVSWDITEAVGLTLLRVFVCDEKVHEISNPPLNGSISVPLQSNTECAVSVFAEDDAGHNDTASTNIMSDQTAATISLLNGGRYFPERRTEAQYRSGQVEYPRNEEDEFYAHLRDWSQVQTIEKSRYRLDLSSDNLPRFKFAAVDTYGPQDGVMRVYYRTFLDGVEKRTWSELTADNEGAYTLPIAYQSMLPVGTTHQSNYVGRTSPESVHAIEFRVIDHVGNVSADGEYLYRFHLVLHTAPMAADDCAFSSAIMNGTINTGVGGQPTLAGFFAYGEDATVMTARILWDTGLTEQSLAPRDDAEIVIDGLAVEWEIRHYTKRLIYPDGEYYWTDWITDGVCHDDDDGWQSAALSYDDANNCNADYRSVPDEQLSSSLRTSMQPDARVTYDGMLLPERGGAYEVAPGYAELELASVVHDPHLLGAANERLYLRTRQVTYPVIGDRVGYSFLEYSGRDYHMFIMYDPGSGSIPWWYHRYWNEYNMLTDLSLSMMVPVVAYADQPELPHESSPEVAELPNVDVHLLGSCANNLSKSWNVEF